MPSDSFQLAEIQKKLEHYCAYQERCHQEVIQKLKNLGAYGTLMDTVIANLIEQNFLNETRFAEHFVRGKFGVKKWGKKRIIRELKQRNISDWNIKSAMKEISDKAYQESGQALAEKFWVSNSNKPLATKKKKVWNAMQYRGWETELIMENILRLEHQKE
jgi:regulatory protein